MQVQSTASIRVQPVAAACHRLTSDRSAAASKYPLQQTRSGRRFEMQRRQVVAMAENPIGQAVKNVQQNVQDFNEAITANAEDTAEATEEGYQAPNLDVDPNEDEAQHEEYRSTQLKNSNRKYAPKSDPTNLSEPRET